MSTFLIIDQDENRSADICTFFRSLGHSLLEASDLGGRGSPSSRVATSTSW